MKKIFTLIALLGMFCGGAWAAPEDFLAGWTEVTSLPTDNAQLEENYYVIVEGDMMLGQGYATRPDAQENIRTAIYVTPCNPAMDTKVVWLLSYSNDFEYGIRNYTFQSRYMQSREDAPWRLQAEWEAAQSRWTRMAFAYADGTWTIQNKGHVDSNFGTNYWGSWSDNDADRYTDGYCLAGNKGFDGNNACVGKFKIYSIARSAFKTVSGIYSMPYSTDFAAKNPFTGGSVVNGGSVQSVLNVNNTTATAWFTSDGENTPYELAKNEEVTVSFTAYHGWLTNGANQVVTLYNSDNVALAQYTYNLGACNLTGVTVAGQAQTVAAYNCQSFSNYGGKNANGLTGNQSYKTTDGYNPVFTFVVSESGRCSVNVKYTHHNIDNTYTANVAEGVKMDLAKIEITSGSNNGDRTICIDNLNVTSIINETPKADYAVKYVDEEGTEIKEQTVGNAEVGSNPQLGASDKNTFVVGEKKYVYANDNASEITIAEDGSTVVTVNFQTLGKYNYSVTSSLGSTIATGSAFTDETVNVSWSKCVNVDGQWYATPAPYGVTITSAEPTKEVTYTANNEVAYFFEAESILSRNYGNPNGNYSGGTSAAVYTGATLTMKNIAPATYTITLNTTVRRANDDGFNVEVSTNGSDWVNVGELILPSNNAGDFSIENVVLPANGSIRLVENKGQNLCHYVDYITLNTTAVSCDITAAGYATFSAPVALNLNAIEGGVAYVATKVNGETITIEPASGIVPANTGLIIKGNAGTCTIPVSAEAGVAPENLLVAVTADNTEITSGYVLGVDNDEVKFLQIDSQSAVLNAGKSYLPIQGSGRALRFVEGEANGINDVNVEAVAAPAKYVVNGKLVIEKAGKMFNAAGAQIK